MSEAQITFGPPDFYEEQEVVALLGIPEPAEEPAALGRGDKRETFVLEVGVKVHDPGCSDAQEVDTRGFALAEAVATAVEGYTNKSLPANPNSNEQGPVQTALIDYIRTDGPLPAEGGGWVIFLRVGVGCVARIGRG